MFRGHVLPIQAGKASEIVISWATREGPLCQYVCSLAFFLHNRRKNYHLDSRLQKREFNFADSNESLGKLISPDTPPT
jgi:hypothetical protein